MNNINYNELTPMMKQYYDIKIDNMDSILMFRLGDFYEMFFDDAKIAAKELDIVLTARNSKDKKKIPMCGVPHHSADNHIQRLINKGYKVAICEQLENPEEADGIVERGIIRIITPGTNLLSTEGDESNNFLASVYTCDYDVGFCYVDFSTGDLYITSFSENYNDQNSLLRNYLSILEISELIVNDNNLEIEDIISHKNILVNLAKDGNELGFNEFLSKINFVDISSNEIRKNLILKNSLKNLYDYLQSTQFGAIDHIRKINFLSKKNYMILDRHTLTSLDVFSETGKKQEGTLFHLMDKTRTAMGSRLLRYFLEHPLKDQKMILSRLEIVEKFISDLMSLDKIRALLYQIYDLERIMVKISGTSHSPKDLLQLKNSIEVLPELFSIIDNYNIKEIESISIDTISDLSNIFFLLNKSLLDKVPVSYREGKVIKTGYSTELDNLKSSTINSKTWISSYEKKLKEETGISNLKIKYNRILGYFIEVTKSNIDKVPDYFIRKQTLVGSERYFTEKLKEAEVKITSSDEVINNLEENIYLNVRSKLLEHYDSVIETSKLIAYVDVLSTFSFIAFENNYTKPQISENNEINIIGGRHPIVELNIDNFIENDTLISNDINFVLLTGPNMAGKSTYMRQIALMSIMMQIGSFIPATEASMPVFDRVFTRIGAQDDLYMGESTFMVEMKEMSDIIDNATKDSLIILDEVGRGTSTYDGLSIARALIEYIITNLNSKTIFATHFHELTDLEEKFDNIKNQTMDIKDQDGDIQFLRKVIDGTTDKSYGIHVATLAGIKDEIINSANEYLIEYESQNYTQNKNVSENLSENLEVENQKRISDLEIKYNEIFDSVKNIDINSTTPIEALDLLNKLKEMIVNAKKN